MIELKNLIEKEVNLENTSLQCSTRGAEEVLSLSMKAAEQALRYLEEDELYHHYEELMLNTDLSRETVAHYLSGKCQEIDQLMINSWKKQKYDVEHGISKLAQNWYFIDFPDCACLALAYCLQALNEEGQEHHCIQRASELLALTPLVHLLHTISTYFGDLRELQEKEGQDKYRTTIAELEKWVSTLPVTTEFKPKLITEFEMSLFRSGFSDLPVGEFPENLVRAKLVSLLTPTDPSPFC